MPLTSARCRCFVSATVGQTATHAGRGPGESPLSIGDRRKRPRRRDGAGSRQSTAGLRAASRCRRDRRGRPPLPAPPPGPRTSLLSGRPQGVVPGEPRGGGAGRGSPRPDIARLQRNSGPGRTGPAAADFVMRTQRKDRQRELRGALPGRR